MKKHNNAGANSRVFVSLYTGVFSVKIYGSWEDVQFINKWEPEEVEQGDASNLDDILVRNKAKKEVHEKKEVETSGDTRIKSHVNDVTFNPKEFDTKEGIPPEEPLWDNEDEDKVVDYLEKRTGKHVMILAYSLRSIGRIPFIKKTNVSSCNEHFRTVSDSCWYATHMQADINLGTGPNTPSDGNHIDERYQDVKPLVSDHAINIVKTETKDYRTQSRYEQVTVESTDKHESVTSVSLNFEASIGEAQCSLSMWIQEWKYT